jgi:acyl-CoA synthetase (AMP-forming)/AMP-acid ligase II
VNLTHTLAHHADRYGDRTAVAGAGEQLTWSQLRGRVELTAGALASAGVGRGDVVAVLLHNSPTFLELMYACSHIGAVFMPLNWRLAGPELEYIVNHAQARLLVSEAELAELVARAAPLCCEVVAADDHNGWPCLNELRAGARPVREPAPVGPDDLARLMYTSGTTSRPKGVMITFANLEAKNIGHLVEFGISAEHRALVCGPLYHVGALDMITTTVLQAGGTVHILRRFEAGEALAAMERHAITHTWLAPVMTNAILDHPSVMERDLGSVQLINGGGEKMPLPLIDRLVRAFPNAWFADAYGMTETVSGDTFLDRRMTTAKLGSVGKPVFNCELRVVDEHDADVPAGTQGEIVMRGPKVCRGYLRDEDATARTIRDGWLHTGDVGVLDEDGYLYIVDRLKDMILSGGENVASSEVERVLYEHPEVVEVAVVARPHGRWGEVPIAYVVFRDSGLGPAELEAFCRERLSGFKVPKAFRIVDELPRNPAGKVLKRVLRERESANADDGT